MRSASRFSMPGFAAALLVLVQSACSSESEASAVPEVPDPDAATDGTTAEAGGESGAMDTGTAASEGGSLDTAAPNDASSDTSNDGAGDAMIATTPYVYVGCGNGDIVQYDYDRPSGTMTEKRKINGGSNPSFLAVHPTTKYLYAVNEGSDQVAAFSLASGTGALTLLNRVSSAGGGPAFVSVDATGKNVLVANYGGGTVAVFRVLADGKLGAKTDDDAPGANAHSILAAPGNAFVYAPTLGVDAIAQYAFDANAGTLTSLNPAKASTASGAGPRHIAFHPSKPWAFVVNEKSDSVIAFDIGTSGALTARQTLTTLPAGSDGNANSCADIHVSASGKYLYASNRGHNSVAMFAITEAGADAGKLTVLGHEPTGGSTPRNFALDEPGALLLAANLGSGNVVTFRIGADGKLTKLKTNATCGAPNFVTVIDVPK